MSTPSQRAFDQLHADNLAKYELKIKKAYLQAIREISFLAQPLKLDANGEFFFKNNKKVNAAVDAILKELNSNIYGATTFAIENEWDLANDKTNEIANWVFGENIDKLTPEQLNKYFTNNESAKNAFIKRKVGGLNLSQKVWNNTTQFKQELELALELGIGKGKSADNLSRSVRQYLNEPDRLFRRVRDENGVLRLSKAAKAYSPGRGVYRSSYKNALRLTRNENNRAYESAQKEKREQQEFVVGVRIAVSPAHNPANDKGGVSCLALQGNYPKDFDFTYKHHVNCICTSFDILKTREELDQDVQQILQGKTPNTKSANEVNKIPDSFTNYFKENEKKFENWATKPMVLTLNN